MEHFKCYVAMFTFFNDFRYTAILALAPVVDSITREDCAPNSIVIK